MRNQYSTVQDSNLINRGERFTQTKKRLVLEPISIWKILFGCPSTFELELGYKRNLQMAAAFTQIRRC